LKGKGNVSFVVDPLATLGSVGSVQEKKEDKKSSKRNEAKNKAALWQEYYKKSKLTKAEVDQLKHELIIRGVDQHRINPKSVNNIQLFGEINKETYVWNEGLLSSIFRQYSKDHTSKKKWIVLDGPIDYIWVENLNSVLDDN